LKLPKYASGCKVITALIPAASAATTARLHDANGLLDVLLSCEVQEHGEGEYSSGSQVLIAVIAPVPCTANS